ncbi:penicillin-binding protein 2 [Rarobacter faecitabidus]|uniref:Cell division protein FtsI (Penicillin-binding protein 3) n=1 Tax=Rarobacter faecitabidus TaxID=13243 RepID=A0A542ZW81_RARFA|nr:penicillin-binding protein 2 [Rarobacter faecitabidus]TQL64623.1 cell division protein FtsI (penicillin-binding protein 3) [Rarobacter faecitabidus]
MRTNWLVGMAAAVLVLFVGRLVWIQGFEASALAAEAYKQITFTREVQASRGDITDVNGVVMATSVKRYNLTVNQRELAKWTHKNEADIEVGGPAEAARLTSDLLDMNEAELAAIYTGDRMFKYVKKGLLPEVWDAISSLRIAGLYSEETSQRVYPAGTVGGNIVGFVGSTGEGKAGIESAFNEQLTGTPGSRTYERSGTGHVIPAGKQTTVAAQPGDNITLTIDRDIQYVAAHALAQQIKKYGASGGSATVVDIPTGSVLALAESGSVDPNKPGATDESNRGAKSVSDVFEPGSTAKVITVAALLETGLATPKSKYTVPDRYTTSNNQTFKDSHDHEKEKWTLTGILSNSSNTGTLMAAEDLPTQVRYDYLRKFGFGEKTGIELAGESRGILHDVDDWDGRTKHAVLFGQGVSVTALQAVDVFATIGNGGKRVSPHLVQSITSADGTVTTKDAGEQTQVISKEVADQLLRMLESTVIDGTGKPGAIPGYRVAAKTGTAQAADASGQMNDIVSSFIGVVPAEKPRLAISVVINNPSERISIYGGPVAGPVFAEVGSYALQRLGVEPSTESPKLYKEEW